MKLAGERRLVRIAAFERQLAQRGVGVPKAIAGPANAQPGQILPPGKAEESPDSLIELERGKPRSHRQLRNTQGLIEMVVDIGERGGKRRRDLSGSGQSWRVARNAGEAAN